MRTLILLLRDRRAGAAAEFALVLPLLLLFLFGIIDVGRLMWTWNQAEKATQMGVRFAVVTEVIPVKLRDDFAATYNLVGGDPVPVGTFSSTICDTSNCSGNWGYDGAAFDRVVARMAAMYPAIGDGNVRVRYDNVGLGYAGDPNGPDVAALVTVSLTGLTFQPLAFVPFGASINLPDFSAALTLEDGQGIFSN
jgi:hypothetical protein